MPLLKTILFNRVLCLVQKAAAVLTRDEIARRTQAGYQQVACFDSVLLR